MRQKGEAMTSFEMRSNSLFMRNNFKATGKWDIPIIKKQNLSLDDVKLIAYSDTKQNDRPENTVCGVHFFIDDYRFTGIYNNPERSIKKLSQYAFLLSPDYSTYSDMNYWRQLKSAAHSRWVGAYWQSKGLKVIPTMTWSDARSYSFCFDGIEKNSIVAIGMIGCKSEKNAFLRGYNAMIERIEPKTVICFGTPFDEMHGNIPLPRGKNNETSLKNCGEFNGINNAISHNSNTNNLCVYSISLEDLQTYQPCRNCQTLYYNHIKSFIDFNINQKYENIDLIDNWKEE
jgi:hypothetical protein